MLEEKIKEIIGEDKPEEVTKLRKLFYMTIHPEQFCPKCSEQMFAEGLVYRCINCNHVTEGEAPRPVPKASAQIPKPNAPAKPIPKELETMLSTAERVANPKKRVGKSIRDLVNSVETGVPGSSDSADSAAIRMQDKNANERTNWV